VASIPSNINFCSCNFCIYIFLWKIFEAVVGITLLFIGCFLTFFGKAVSDVVDNSTVWSKSIFSEAPEESFFGAKDKTWVRKDHDNFIWNYLFHTILVFLTDIWHLGNTVRHTGIYISVLGGLLCSLMIDLDLQLIMVLMGCYICLNVIGFHIFYHYILRNKGSDRSF
jgi:hypothetical protein